MLFETTSNKHPPSYHLLLDRKQRMVLVCDESGRTIRTVGPGGLQKPFDVAVVSAASPSS